MANAGQMMYDENCVSMQLFLPDWGLHVWKAAAAASTIYIFLYILSLQHRCNIPALRTWPRARGKCASQD